MANKLDREPVAAAAGLNVVVQAAMQVLVAFNVPLTPVQTGAITTFVVVFSAWWVRGKVWAPIDAQGQPVIALPKILHVESDPESPRLAAKHGMSDAELLELIEREGKKPTK